MKQKKYKRLVPVDGHDFRAILKKIRLDKKLTTPQLGLKINRRGQQIQRYETPPSVGVESQIPPATVLRDLCLALQVDANVLLGLVWEQSDERFENNVIYEWKLKGDKLFWWCPICRRENVTYNDYSKKPSLLKTQSVQCEYDDCGSYFEKLYMEKE